MPAGGHDAALALERDGFAILPDFLDAAEVAAGRANLARYFPTPEEFFAAAPEKFAWLQAGQFAGLIDFPFVEDALNDHLTHPRLVALAWELVGADDVRLVQGRAWAKYGGNVDFDQPLHRDYPNHTLAYPSAKAGLRELIGFIYYSDVTPDSGPTCLLPHQHASDVPVGTRHLPEGSRRQQEVQAVGPAGTVVLYSPLTFHRGSALGPPPAYRWITGFSYRAAGVDWTANQCWPPAGTTDELHRFMARATVEQRNVLGFPPPGHPYWDDDTRAGIAARYPGIDLSPYRQ
jgi:hypothetical protein